MSSASGSLPSRWRRGCAGLFAVAVLAPLPGSAEAPGASDDVEDFFDVPLAELTEIPVVSVAGIAQDWFATPAAVHVVTREEILRSGHTHVAELLRMVPGFYVGRVTSSEWTTGVRGFSDVFYPYLQAMVDGRVIYNELFSGVYWDVQTTLLEDVEQIEVVRGPGATLWGANAVNGVINVTSRNARETRGLYAEGGGGSEERAFGMGRYGAELAPGLAVRGWGRFFGRDSTVDRDDDHRHDSWSVFRGGARLDWEVGDRTTFMAQGEGYTTPELEQSRRVPAGVVFGEGEARGGHGLLRLEHRGGSAETRDQRNLSVQAYYDFEDRENVLDFEQERHTVDLDLRHHLVLGSHHELMWGAGYRYRRTDTSGVPTLRLSPSDEDSDLVTLFLQDTITLLPDTLFLMLGSKAEYNSFTDFEFQPSGRIWWTPNENHTLWAAISRPVRVPSLINQHLDITLFTTELEVPGFINVLGSDRLDAEELLAYEVGYRVRPWESLTLDFAAFYFDYDEIYRLEPVSAATSDVFRFENGASAESAGAEVSVRWSPFAVWRLHGSYSYLRVDAYGEGLAPAGGLEDRDPEHQFQLRSYLDVTEDLELNAALYYVDDVGRFDVSSYFRLDLGLTWRPLEHVELTVWGQNLTESRHRESGVATANEGPAELERGVYGRARVAF